MGKIDKREMEWVRGLFRTSPTDERDVISVYNGVKPLLDAVRGFKLLEKQKKRYRHKEVISFKKNQKVHLDELYCSQSQFMGCFDKENDDEMSDNTICNADCKMTMEWN